MNTDADAMHTGRRKRRPAAESKARPEELTRTRPTLRSDWVIRAAVAAPNAPLVEPRTANRTEPMTKAATYTHALRFCNPFVVSASANGVLMLFRTTIQQSNDRIGAVGASHDEPRTMRIRGPE